ncbi:hypothetical protein MHYP_G00016180 [Metynnis hypsauchen]
MSVCSRSFLLGLMIILHLQSVEGFALEEPEQCCYKFFAGKIPEHDIMAYKLTRDCPKAGVIFTTKKGAHICADPSFEWVRSTMRSIDKTSNHSSELHKLEVETETRPVPETSKPGPVKDLDGHQTETQFKPALDTPSPDPTTVSQGFEPKVQTQLEVKTSKPESTTVMEPNWFCKV